MWGLRNILLCSPLLERITDWGHLYLLVKAENYKVFHKTILKQHLWTQLFLIKVSTLADSNGSVLGTCIKWFTVSQVKRRHRSERSIPRNWSIMNFPSEVRSYSHCTVGRGLLLERRQKKKDKFAWIFFFSHFCSAEGVGFIIIFKPEQPKDLFPT